MSKATPIRSAKSAASSRAIGQVASDVDDLAFTIDNQCGLLQWIESARRILDRIATEACDGSDLEAALQKRDIRFCMPWGERESAAVFHMQEEIAQGVLGITGQIKELVASQQEAPHG